VRSIIKETWFSLVAGIITATIAATTSYFFFEPVTTDI
jgi:hypothetical protein